MGPFSSRELAFALWLIPLGAWMLAKSSTRRALFKLFMSATKWKVLVPLLVMGVYTTAVVGFLSSAGLRSPGTLKDAVVWFLVAGIALVFAALDGTKRPGFWRGAALDQFKALVLIEYLGSEASFSLPTELVLVPVLLTIAVMYGVATTRTEFAAVARILAVALGVFALATIAAGIGATAGRIATGEFVDVLRALALEPLLTLLFLPLLYLHMLAVLYDELRWRIAFKNPAGPTFARHAASRIILHGRLRLRYLQGFAKANAIVLLGIPTDAAVSELFRSYESSHGAEPERPARPLAE